ncbi:MAG: hypothetical protein ACXVRS_17200 [Gaiellaceae bacterium]
MQVRERRTARKALNIFLRDVLYNAYLADAYAFPRVVGRERVQRPPLLLMSPAGSSGFSFSSRASRSE